MAPIMKRKRSTTEVHEDGPSPKRRAFNPFRVTEEYRGRLRAHDGEYEYNMARIQEAKNEALERQNARFQQLISPAATPSTPAQVNATTAYPSPVSETKQQSQTRPASQPQPAQSSSDLFRQSIEARASALKRQDVANEQHQSTVRCNEMQPKQQAVFGGHKSQPQPETVQPSSDLSSEAPKASANASQRATAPTDAQEQHQPNVSGNEMQHHQQAVLSSHESETQVVPNDDHEQHQQPSVRGNEMQHNQQAFMDRHKSGTQSAPNDDHEQHQPIVRSNEVQHHQPAFLGRHRVEHQSVTIQPVQAENMDEDDDERMTEDEGESEGELEPESDGDEDMEDDDSESEFAEDDEMEEVGDEGAYDFRGKSEPIATSVRQIHQTVASLHRSLDEIAAAPIARWVKGAKATRPAPKQHVVKGGAIDKRAAGKSSRPQPSLGPRKLESLGLDSASSGGHDRRQRRSQPSDRRQLQSLETRGASSSGTDRRQHGQQSSGGRGQQSSGRGESSTGGRRRQQAEEEVDYGAAKYGAFVQTDEQRRKGLEALNRIRASEQQSQPQPAPSEVVVRSIEDPYADSRAAEMEKRRAKDNSRANQAPAGERE